MMKSLRGTDRIQVGGVFGKWDHAVGAQIAAHVRPIKLDQATLLVEADTATWATQVKFLADTIITRLREEAGVEVSDIEVRVASNRRR
jgi:predicted nucleic acid-binding Zn ribbon protein